MSSVGGGGGRPRGVSERGSSGQAVLKYVSSRFY